MKNILNKTLLLAIAAVGYIFASCNSEPPECGEEFPPLHCQLELKSGRKIDSISVYMPEIDSVLYHGTALPSVVNIPLSVSGDTTFVQFMVIGISKTSENKYCSMLGISSCPELQIVNLECGPVYCFKELGYMLYSMTGNEHIYQIDTVREVVNGKEYVNIDKRMLRDTLVNYVNAIDSLWYMEDEINQDNNVHAKIFF